MAVEATNPSPHKGLTPATSSRCIYRVTDVYIKCFDLWLSIVKCSVPRTEKVTQMTAQDLNMLARLEFPPTLPFD